MIARRLSILGLIVAVSCLPIKADGTGQNREDKTTADVIVEQSKELYKVYARGHGCGYTLEDAKSAAINSIMPQLMEKTLSIGALTSYMNADGITTGKGVDRIKGQLMFQGHWELKDGVYQYEVELLINNTYSME